MNINICNFPTEWNIRFFFQHLHFVLLLFHHFVAPSMECVWLSKKVFLPSFFFSLTRNFFQFRSTTFSIEFFVDLNLSINLVQPTECLEIEIFSRNPKPIWMNIQQQKKKDQFFNFTIRTMKSLPRTTHRFIILYSLRIHARSLIYFIRIDI